MPTGIFRHSSASPRPDRGLDLLNLLLALAGSAYGAFIPVYLTGHAWTQTQIGLALTIGMIASMLCQIPAGLIVDFAGSHRRRIVALAIVGIGITPLLFAVLPRHLPILLAMILQAMAGSLLTPALAAISLAVVGRDGLGERLGRNGRYGSIGAGLGAIMMGVCVSAGFEAAIFLIAAALTLPALWALLRVGRDLPAPEVEPIATEAETGGWLAGFALLKDRRVLIFALCLALFQASSIAVLQLAAVQVTAQLGSRAGVVIAAFLLVPQIVVAWLAPWIGRAAERYGRRAVLLAGFATVPLRGMLFALVRNAYALVPVQVLEGAGGGVFGVMMPLVAADLTRKSGHYTLCFSMFGLAAGLGSAASTIGAGWITDHFGRPAAFWVLAGFGVAAVALVALAMPETRQKAETTE